MKDFIEILWKRMLSDTPAFFKRIIAFGTLLGAIGAGILLSPDMPLRQW